MKMVLLDATDGSAAELETLAAEAEHSFEGTCEEVEVGGTITPAEDKCYMLHFMEGSTLDSIFYLATANTAHVAVFTEHAPTEFERTEHFLKSTTGEDIEPLAQTGAGEEEEESGKPWGTAIGAAVLVNIVTFSGLVLLVPFVSSLVSKYPNEFEIITNGFAGGALLGAAVYLLLHEATHLITADTEAKAAASWGCMILLGFLTSSIIDFVIAAIAPELRANVPPIDEQGNAVKGDAGNDLQQPHGEPALQYHPAVGQYPPNMGQLQYPANMGQVPAGYPMNSVAQPGMGVQYGYGGVAVAGGHFGMLDETVDKTDAVLAARRLRILSGVLIGDFMHNFCDGIFIGAAFNLCEHSVGWSVTAATIYHEIAQELSDFVILTDPNQGGLKKLYALAVNFLSGISVIIGVLVVLSQDLSNYDTGMILAYGGGVYVQIGAAECMPRIYQKANTLAFRLLSFLAFFIGALGIGLVLLDHKHCTADGHGHGH